jgi:cobalamin biosynthesis Mg chelatase CobN
LFNKNVVNMSVAENNRNCFSLTDSEGRNIPIMVNLPDDQINPELKRQIFIQPLNPLSAAMTYTLTLSPQLQAKNGALLGVERKIVFSTESGAVAQVKEKEPALAAEAGGADHSAIQAESGNPPAVVMDSEQKGDAEETVNPSPDRPTAGVEDEQVAESLVETSYAEDATGEVLAAEDSRQEKVENQLMDSNNSASPSGMILGVVAIAVLGCGYLILRKKK